MYKNITIVIISSMLIFLSCSTQAMLDDNMIANSPSDYLTDWDKFINEPLTTKKIGNELYLRNYQSTITVCQQIPDFYYNRPSTPGCSSSFDLGQWVWIPTNYDNDFGDWFWITVLRPAYLQYWYDNIIPM